MQDYREYPSGPELAPWVDCFWTKRVRPGGEIERTSVVPDGSVDIIVEAHSGGAGVIGAMRRPKLIEIGRPITLVAVRFRPGGAAPLFDFPLAEISDERHELESCLPRTLGRLGEELAEIDGTPERVERFRSRLSARLHRGRSPDRLVASAVAEIHRAGGRGTVASLARELEVGRRRLERRFRRDVGLAPKELCRIVRLQSLLRRLERRCGRRGASRPGWVGLAHEHGFADQSHLVREFRQLTGTTPSDWLAAH